MSDERYEMYHVIADHTYKHDMSLGLGTWDLGWPKLCVIAIRCMCHRIREPVLVIHAPGAVIGYLTVSQKQVDQLLRGPIE